MKTLALTLVLAVSTASVAAQSGTAVSSQSPTAQPTASDDPGLKGWIARRARSFSSTDPGKDGLLFSAGTIVPGSALAGGIGYRRLDVFGIGLDVETEATISLRLYQEYRLAIGRLGSRGSTTGLNSADASSASLFNDASAKAPGTALYVDARVRDYPRHTVYGIGSQSREDDRADYALTGTSIEGVWQRQFSRALGLSARGGLLDLHLGKGTDDDLLDFDQRFDPTLFPGGVDQPRFVTLGGALVRDTRRHAGAPENGTLAGVAIRRFDALHTGGLDFTRIAVDLRAYTRRAGGIVALRGVMSSDLSAAASASPFYLRQSLGGGELLRGYSNYRFQDQALIHATVEYRWRAHRFIDVAGFVDAGTVAPRVRDLAHGTVRATPGIAVRARTDTRTIARMEWAIGSEGSRIVLAAGPVF